MGTNDGHHLSSHILICRGSSAVSVLIWQLDCFVSEVSINDEANTSVVILVCVLGFDSNPVFRSGSEMCLAIAMLNEASRNREI